MRLHRMTYEEEVMSVRIVIVISQARMKHSEAYISNIRLVNDI